MNIREKKSNNEFIGIKVIGFCANFSCEWTKMFENRISQFLPSLVKREVMF